MAVFRFDDIAVELSLIYLAMEMTPPTAPPSSLDTITTPQNRESKLWLYMDVPDEKKEGNPTVHIRHDLIQPFIEKLAKTAGFICADNVAVNMSKIVSIKRNMFEFYLANKGLVKFTIPPDTAEKILNALPK